MHNFNAKKNFHVRSNRPACPLFAITAALLVFGIDTVGHAAPITVPTRLNPGDEYRLVFLTSTRHVATSTNIATYNAFVTSLAESVPELAALGTSWTAIASTITLDARDNTSTNPLVAVGEEIFNLNNRRVAVDYADFWDGSHTNPINIVETGDGPSPGGGLVVTGTLPDGTRLPDRLFDGPLGSETPGLGSSQLVDEGWIRLPGNQPFDDPHFFYAISGTLVVVPEPSTAALLGLGLVALAAPRRRWARTS